MLAWRNLKLYKTRGIAREVTERRGRFNKRWRRNAKYPWQSAGERYNGVLSPAGVLLAMAYVIILPSFLSPPLLLLFREKIYRHLRDYIVPDRF